MEVQLSNALPSVSMGTAYLQDCVPAVLAGGEHHVILVRPSHDSHVTQCSNIILFYPLLDTHIYIHTMQVGVVASLMIYCYAVFPRCE